MNKRSASWCLFWAAIALVISLSMFSWSFYEASNDQYAKAAWLMALSISTEMSFARHLEKAKQYMGK